MNSSIGRPVNVVHTGQVRYQGPCATGTSFSASEIICTISWQMPYWVGYMRGEKSKKYLRQAVRWNSKSWRERG